MKYVFISLLIIFASNCSLLLDPDPANTSESNFEILWNEFDKMYALFEVKGIDWSQRYSVYKPEITSSTSDIELFSIISDLLAELNDKHVFMSSEFEYFNSGGYPLTDSYFSLNSVKNYLVSSKTAGVDVFTYGLIADSIGYVHIGAFYSGRTGISTRQDWAGDIDNIIQEFQTTDGLIVDVRDNKGGLPQNVMFIADRFADKRRLFMTLQTQNGLGHHDFNDEKEYYIEQEGPSQFTGPIILLTNSLTISGGEWFTLAMKTIPYVTQMGNTTAGAFSLSISRDLPNGWNYTISVQLIKSHDGICYEGVGISPENDLIVTNTAEDLANGIDRELESAIQKLSQILLN